MPSIGADIEEALLPVRMLGLGLAPGVSENVLQEVDAALASVHLLHGHSRTAIKRYLTAEVHICLRDGTFHVDRRSLRRHLRANRKLVRCAGAKNFSFAKMCLVTY